MKICFLVPDGMGLRNYMFSKLLNKFDVSDEITVMTILPEQIIDEVQNLHNRKITYRLMSRCSEAFTGKLLKETITYARLRYNTKKVKNDTIMLNWTRKNKGIKLNFFYLLASFLASFYASYKRILKLEKKYCNYLRKTAYFKQQTEVLKELNPDVIFCTHQRSIDASVITEAAKALNIPTVGAIYSWDNLPKARLLVRSKYYVVWSEFMKEEMNAYYPEIDSKNIFITGTPQFEFYFDKNLHQTREEFFKEWSLDPVRKVLCFSGNDLTFPCDDLYLQDIAEELMKMPENERPQILLRRCPVDLSGRFDKVVAKYPEIIKVSAPLWRSSKEGWDFNLPTYDDVKLLVNVALHSNAVINVGSTMAHDFAVMGKPAIYINYDQPTVKYWSAIVNNKYQHFRSMPSVSCVIWLNSKMEIIDAVKRALQEHPAELKEQQEWFKIIALHPVTEASQNIAKTIKTLATK
ncbi:MAG: hypothetical protein LBV41_01645 [Cytophagaceae bacterium]|jgi:hypothetical protein|nr:hypothetical protein [Cytophagaceae bacterium]